MMVYSKNYLFVFVLNLMCECWGIVYKFETDMITSFSNVQVDRTTKREIEEHFLNKLNREEKLRLCILAKEHALKGGVPLKYIGAEETVKKYNIFKEENESTRAYVVTGLKCPFIPFVLLHLEEESTNNLKTIVQVNPFLDQSYQFHEEVVEFVEYFQTVSLDSRVEWRKNYAYAKLNYKTRWMMCVAAVTRTRYNVIMPPSDNWFEIVGVYRITYPVDSDKSTVSTMRDIVAFPCNTSPKIYLSAVSENVFVVMLVRF